MSRVYFVSETVQVELKWERLKAPAWPPPADSAFLASSRTYSSAPAARARGVQGLSFRV